MTQINRILRLFDDLPWSSFTHTHWVSMQECVPLLHTYTTKLLSLLVTLLPSPLSESEDDAHDSDP